MKQESLNLMPNISYSCNKSASTRMCFQIILNQLIDAEALTLTLIANI